MENPIGRYARDSEGYTGPNKVAHVLGAGVAHTIWRVSGLLCMGDWVHAS